MYINRLTLIAGGVCLAAGAVGCLWVYSKGGQGVEAWFWPLLVLAMGVAGTLGSFIEPSLRDRRRNEYLSDDEEAQLRDEEDRELWN